MSTVRRALLRFRPGRPAESRPSRSDEGFGLIEAIVAMVVLLGVLIPTGYLFTNVLSQSASARQRITALSVAEQWIETLNSQGPPADTNNQPQVGNTISEPSSVLSGITYTVSAVFNWTDASGGSPDFCNTATSPVLGLAVTVSWVGGQSITDQAILNFPAIGNLSNGYLAIQVNGDPAYSAGPPVTTAPNDVFSNPWATRVKTIPIQVSGSNLTTPYSLTPASTGCTFLQLAPGTYTVQVGPGPSSSYVANYNEASSETQALSTQSAIIVVAAQITQVVFQYDEGANVGLSYPTTTTTDDGIQCPNSGGTICLAAGQSPTSTASPSASPVATGIVKTSAGWSVASFPAAMTRIEDVDCASSACIAVGYSSTGGAAAISTNGTAWANSSLTAAWNVANLNTIDCPTSATAPACLALGTTTTGTPVLLTATISGGVATWTLDTIPASNSLSQIVCPSSAAQPVCFVMGTNSSGVGTIFSDANAMVGTTWTTYTQSGMTVSTLTSIGCPSTTFCIATGTGKIGSGSVGPFLISISNSAGATTWKAYTQSGITMSTFTAISCVSGTSCWATGTGKIGSGSVGPIIIYLSSNSGSGSTWKNDTGVPSTVTLGTIVCAATSNGCFALDTSSSGSPGILTLESTTVWQAASLPAGLVSLSQLVCPSSTACYAVGTNATSAVIVVLKAGSWSSATFTGTTGGNPVDITGIACTAATTCEAAGATETAAEVLDTTTGTSFSGSGTPSTLSGLFLDNPPIMVSDSNLQPNTTIEMSAPTTANGPQVQVGPLFPFVAGYSIAAGYCASELTTASASASTVPGATPSTSPAAPTVILPMGLLPIEATNTSGVPISGATISIVDTSCASSAQLTPLSSGSYPALGSPPASPSNPTSYSMPTTGVDCLSRIAVIYGTYQVTVTLGGTHATTTVVVNPTSIVVGATTYYSPAFVPIPD